MLTSKKHKKNISKKCNYVEMCLEEKTWFHLQHIRSLQAYELQLSTLTHSLSKMEASLRQEQEEKVSLWRGEVMNMKIGGDSGLRDPVTTLLLTLKLNWHLNELKNRPLKIQSSLSCRKLLWRTWLPRGSCVYSWTGLRTLSPDSWLPSPSATSRLADLATRAG